MSGRWVSCFNPTYVHFIFNSTHPLKFIDKEKLSINIDELIISIKNHSQKLSLDKQQIKQDLSDALCKVLGTWNANDVKKEDWERELRLAYELSYFYQTQIYQLMVNWQSNNHPYQIF